MALTIWAEGEEIIFPSWYVIPSHVSEDFPMIGYVVRTWEGRPERGWRKFIQVDGDDTPGTLNEELHEEAGCAQRPFALWENPGRNEDGRQQGRNNDSSAPSDKLRQVPDYCATYASTSLHQNRCARGPIVAHLFLGQHERSIRVLRGVGVIVEL
jgi:hypothetical protein